MCIGLTDKEVDFLRWLRNQSPRTISVVRAYLSGELPLSVLGGELYESLCCFISLSPPQEEDEIVLIAG